jgi:hypothetical protein
LSGRLKLFEDSHPLSGFILLLLPILAYMNQIKALVTSEVDRVVITTNICWDRMAREMEYREFRWTEESNSSREMWMGDNPWD